MNHAGWSLPRRSIVAVAALALLFAGAVNGAAAQTATVQGPAGATTPGAGPVLTGTITCLVHPDVNAAATAVFSGSPALGEVPEQSLRLRIVLQVFQAQDGTLQAESSVGPLPLVSPSEAAQPDPDLIQRAMAILEGGNVSTLTGAPWSVPPEVAGISTPNLQGIVIVELWDTATNAGVVVYGDTADNILRAAIGQLATVGHLGPGIGPMLQGSCE
ncbi:MAG TPA: hypothetical protein VK821_02350 [Dehalococcoidia bacterium]|nr:hypothetical protein [Dehalococcoidia bacterium]